jgi:hypothetical protein
MFELNIIRSLYAAFTQIKFIINRLLQEVYRTSIVQGLVSDYLFVRSTNNFLAHYQDESDYSKIHLEKDFLPNPFFSPFDKENNQSS